MSGAKCVSVRYTLRIDQPLYRRNIEPGLRAALSDTPVVAITGPRQSGKSTLAEKVADEIGAEKASFDDAELRAAAIADPAGFVEGASLPLLIDEFQKAPEVLDAIKARVDRERRGGARPAGLFLLTGSANVWATLRISESLAGRAERIPLWPLSQGEIAGRRETFLEALFGGGPPGDVGAEGGRSEIAERIVAGGYPEMLARPSAGRRARWVRSYLEMILERDARDLASRARQLDELPRLLEFAATRMCSLLDLADLGAGVGMRRDSVSRYLRLLELMYLVQRTPAWRRNLGQRLIKAPKLRLPDSGLAAQLVGYDARRFEDLEDPFNGALFENFVAGELTKQLTWSEREVRLHHLRTAGGREVDIVLEDSAGEVVGVETKLGATPRERDFSGLAHLRDKLGGKFKAGVLLNTGTRTLSFGDRLWVAPVASLWDGVPSS